MFKKVLIANRGEIAVRVIAVCKELGIKAVAIFSEPDRDGRHVSLADECYRLEGPPNQVYLDGAQILDIAKRAGCEAVHPGYGFLSENAQFAQACLDAGLKFIGPRPEVIARMGSKVESRRAMEAAGVPVVPGTTDPVTTVDEVAALGTKYGYPIAIKASAGGGGRGLKVVQNEAAIENALTSAQREGLSYFGSKEVYVEKYLEHPKHIEVQVLGDDFGNVVQLGERDCSSQRRHQKLLEETPALKLSPAVRQRLLDCAVKGTKSLNYTSAGTLEFLVAGDEFYFLEVNTRVQVEHPITELVTGIDIVKEQIMVAAGQPLSFSQQDVVARGHAIEFRINAEDPFKGFLPSPGAVKNYKEPRWPWIRLDTACYPGYQVLPFYDSLLAKLIVWGRTREEAISRGKLALNSYVIEGISTTIPFHLALLSDPVFVAGDVDTKYVEAVLSKKFMAEAKAAVPAATPSTSVTAPGNNGFSNGVERREPRKFEVEVEQRVFKVAVSELSPSAESATKAVSSLLADKAAIAPKRELGTRPIQSGRSDSSGSTRTGSGEVKAAMHGVVKEILVKEGDTVAAQQKLLIFEAMKMESEITAERAGKVSKVNVKAGETVEPSQTLLVISDTD